MKYSIRFARNTSIDNIQQETVHAPDEQTARDMFTCCDCYVYSCETVISDRDNADILRAAHAVGFTDAVLVSEPSTVGESVAVVTGTSELTPELNALNRAAGYDIVDAICSKTPARIEWEKKYLEKRQAHYDKHFGGK